MDAPAVDLNSSTVKPESVTVVSTVNFGGSGSSEEGVGEGVVISAFSSAASFSFLGAGNVDTTAGAGRESTADV